MKKTSTLIPCLAVGLILIAAEIVFLYCTSGKYVFLPESEQFETGELTYFVEQNWEEGRQNVCARQEEGATLRVGPTCVLLFSDPLERGEEISAPEGMRFYQIGTYRENALSCRIMPVIALKAAPAAPAEENAEENAEETPQEQMNL